VRLRLRIHSPGCVSYYFVCVVVDTRFAPLVQGSTQAVSMAVCKNCAGTMRGEPVEFGREAHYSCSRCKKIYTWEVNYLVECPDPLGHLLSPPKWAKIKYAKNTPPLRAHDQTVKGAK
jgi:hypothetical protein